jgi:spore germination protein YaaH
VRTSSRRGRGAAPILLAALLAAAVLPVGGPTSSIPGASAATAIRPRITGIKPLSHEVYGYLPYWRLDSGTVARLRYDLVSTIAFFGLGIKGSGAIDTGWVGYKEYVGADAAAVTNAAHDWGVRVVPTFQMFDSASGAPKMSAFLGSTTAQDRFIAEALALMAARRADGAGLDFEPVRAVNDRADAYVAFVGRFRAAMQARFPGSTLVNATSAGASETVISGLVPVVDRQMLMAYNYHWSGSTITGAIAPLDNATRTVKIHVARMLQWAPASSVLLGVPYYGYDWPVTSSDAHAAVQEDKTTYGPVRSVTYKSARDFLAARPWIARRYDALEGSGYYTYWDAARSTFRQAYFEEERSLAAKYDYVIATGLAGIGIWTLDNDRGYSELWNVLRSRFYAPVHALQLSGSIAYVRRESGSVYVKFRATARDVGTMPERGRFRWTIRDARGQLIKSGSWAAQTVYPGGVYWHDMRVRLGYASRLPAGTYTLRVRFETASRTWRAPNVDFRQPY